PKGDQLQIALHPPRQRPRHELFVPAVQRDGWSSRQTAAVRQGVETAQAWPAQRHTGMTAWCAVAVRLAFRQRHIAFAEEPHRRSLAQNVLIIRSSIRYPKLFS